MPKDGKKPAKKCADCGKAKPILGRGLCGACYYRNKRAGTLDEKFPSKRASAKGVPPIEKLETPEERMEPLPSVKKEEIVGVALKNKKQRGHLHELTLRIFDRERDLFADIVASAERERRAVSAEILCRLERLAEIERKNGEQNG